MPTTIADRCKRDAEQAVNAAFMIRTRERALTGRCGLTMWRRRNEGDSMATLAPICDFGWKAPDFRLLATDGKFYSLADVRGPKGTLVVFMCNHCPYVKAVVARLVR